MQPKSVFYNTVFKMYTELNKGASSQSDAINKTSLKRTPTFMKPVMFTSCENFILFTVPLWSF